MEWRVLGFAALVACGVAAAPAAAAECPGAAALRVPGADRLEVACLDDLTTAGTTASGHTDPGDWSALHARGTKNPSGVPGTQLDGHFPDTSTFNYEHGWAHDAQFVVRLPEQWNGKLVISGASGVQRQYSNDFLIADWVLARGYAFASTDKGNSSATFYQDGATPGDAGAEWNQRMTELTLATRDVIRQRYGRLPERTYVAGISQGGYVTRWQIENHPELYDGGVDWEGTLWTADAPNLFTVLPAALRSYPRYRATGDAAAHDAIIAAGFPAGSEFLWDLHYGEFWDLSQRAYREEFDPEYDGAVEAGVPFCQSGTPMCDADYDYAARRPQAGPALEKVALHGRLEKPLITLHRLARRAAPDLRQRRPLRAPGRAGRQHRPAPLLRRRARHPRRPELRPLARQAAPDPALLPRGLRGDGALGGGRQGRAAEPVRAGSEVRRHGQRVRSRDRSRRRCARPAHGSCAGRTEAAAAASDADRAAAARPGRRAGHRVRRGHDQRARPPRRGAPQLHLHAHAPAARPPGDGPLLREPGAARVYPTRTGTPWRGTSVTPRITTGSGSGRVGRSSARVTTRRITSAISACASAAPMQRRMPPPKGSQA
jgi:hypothetical protein